MAQLAGSADFFNNLRSSLDQVKRGLDENKQGVYKLSQFSDKKKALDSLKKTKEQEKRISSTTKTKTNASVKQASKPQTRAPKKK